MPSAYYMSKINPCNGHAEKSRESLWKGLSVRMLIVCSIVVLLVAEKDFEFFLEAFNHSLMACPTSSAVTVLIVAFTCGYMY